MCVYVCVCDELFKRQGRGVALATLSGVATQGRLVYIYKRDCLCVCVCVCVCVCL